MNLNTAIMALWSCSMAHCSIFVQATAPLRKICTGWSHQTTRHRHRRAIFSFYGSSATNQWVGVTMKEILREHSNILTLINILKRNWALVHIVPLRTLEASRAPNLYPRHFYSRLIIIARAGELLITPQQSENGSWVFWSKVERFSRTSISIFSYVRWTICLRD